MKKIFTTTLLSLILGFAFGSEWVTIKSDKAKPAQITLKSSDIQTSVIRFGLDGFYKIPVETPKGIQQLIALPKGTRILEKGAPDLPKLTASVIIPDVAGMKAEVISSSYKEYQNIDLAPSKGLLSRDVDPSTVPYEYSDVYKQDAFYPGKIVELRDPYIIRDYRGQTVVLYPFQYNPVTKVLRVLDEVTIKVYKADNNGKNPLVRNRELTSISKEFRPVYERHFLNANQTRYTPVDEHGNMLIISYGDFMDEMQDFVDWKIQKGTPTEMVDVATIGNNSSAIKSYINTYYNDNGLTFVLLVGDAAQVTPSYSYGDSDNEYTYLVGNDHYPDLFIGRFSAETGSQVETQVERTLEYEKNPYTDIDWFTVGIGIASSQGPGDEGEYDYEHIRNIHDDLLAYTYTDCHELFDGSQGGDDEPGNPTPAMVAQAINDGSSIINYTGHGSSSSWGTSGFSSSDVNNLTNEGMLPFIWSVACVNGDFVGKTCFAEAWLRAENNGEPSGAIATLMSTVNQHWDPPMCGQDEMVDILVESYPDNIKRTFAALSMNGCMQMNDEYGSSGVEMTDTWTVFGDPSVMVRTDMPDPIPATYDDVTFIGVDQITVTCPVEGALVCLTLDGEILATAYVEGGTATLQFPALEDYGIITITITAYNHIPHIGEIEIIQPEGPYIMYHSHINNDKQGNDNGFVDYGETIYLTLTLENMGNDDGIDVETNINTMNSYVEITDDSDVFELIPAQDTATVQNGYLFTVADDIPDMTKVNFDVQASSGDDTWESDFDITVNAPVLQVRTLEIVDTANGNGDGVFDPGETVVVKIKNRNNGHCTAYDTEATIGTESPYLYLDNTEATVGNIPIMQNKSAMFTVTADSATPQGEVVYFDYEVTCGGYSKTKTFTVEVGMIYEDWETGDFTKFDWVTQGDKDWVISDEIFYEGDFSAENGNIGNNEYSELKITIEAKTYDSISFWVKTSTEVNRDKLEFYIGNSKKAEWSGIVDWQHVSIPISSGTHTLKWKYTKDELLSYGDDCVWIDNIIFPPIPVLSAFAGRDSYTCEGTDFQCKGIAQNYVSLEWSTKGDGTFSDPTILEPLYTPGSTDIESGQVKLILRAYDDEGNEDVDNMILSISNEPDKPEIPSGPDYVDLSNTKHSEYTTRELEFTESYEWNLEPEEAGTLSGNDTIVNVTWNPDFLGEVMVYVKAINNCGESEISEGFSVTIDKTVGIPVKEPSAGIRIFPNPTHGLFYLEFNDFDEEQADIQIVSITGSMVYKETISINGTDHKQQINLGSLNKGIYYVTVTTTTKKLSTKLVITN